MNDAWTSYLIKSLGLSPPVSIAVIGTNDSQVPHPQQSWSERDEWAEVQPEISSSANWGETSSECISCLGRYFWTQKALPLPSSLLTKSFECVEDALLLTRFHVVRLLPWMFVIYEEPAVKKYVLRSMYLHTLLVDINYKQNMSTHYWLVNK